MLNTAQLKAKTFGFTLDYALEDKNKFLG